MSWKQHTGFRSRLLVMLFLFFNCVCTAAPVLKLTGENYKEPVSTGLAQVPYPTENEEENHTSACGYTNHFNHITIRKQCDKRLNHVVGISAVSSFVDEPPKIYLHRTAVLSLPGYYTFLFRYNLF